MAYHPRDESPGYIRKPLTGLNNLDAQTKPDNAVVKRNIKGEPYQAPLLYFSIALLRY